MKKKLKKIKCQESEPVLSSYDSRNWHSFGTISFCIGRRTVEASLVDRNAEKVDVFGRIWLISTVELDDVKQKEFKNFVNKIWGADEIIIEIPAWLSEVLL